MSEVSNLLIELQRRGVRLWVDGPNLRYRSPVGVLSKDELSRLAINKVEIIAQLATADSMLLRPASRDGRSPLSFAQQRLWFLSQMEGVSEAYHIPVGLELEGMLNAVALRQALDHMVARHESLRTIFEVKDGEPFQQIGPADAGFRLVEEDLTDAKNAEVRLAALIAEESSKPFDLEVGPLIRGRLVRVAPERHVLLITMHHIVSDGWSMRVLIREFNALYAAFIEGVVDPLLPLDLQYSDYAIWQRRWLSGETLDRQAQYWREQLRDSPTLLELPTDYHRPERQDLRGDYVDFELNETLAGDLKALSRRHGLTLFMTAFAGWALVLSRLSGQKDLVIGVPSANRGRVEIEGLIGFFVNTLAIRTDLTSDPTIKTLLEQIRATTIAAQENQDLPFEQVVELVQPTRSPAHTPLFQVMFAWQNNEAAHFDLPGLSVSKLDIGYRKSPFDLALFMWEQDGLIVGRLRYATSLFKVETMKRYLDYFQRVLGEIARNGHQTATCVPMLPPTERRLLLDARNDTAAPFAEAHCLHQLFEIQVARNPDAVAVVCREQSLTYGQLNARANQLARRLHRIGVRPDDRVAICAERTPETIVGLMAILKAGGAYVPLDPAYPTERLAMMLQDSVPVAVLSDAVGRQALKGLSWKSPTLELYDDDASGLMQAQSNLEATPDYNSNHLAYVIYTSGSTGTPKGVAMPHRALVNLLTRPASEDEVDWSSRTMQFASIGFDASAMEIFGTLLNGGAVILTDHKAVIDWSGFCEWVNRYHISLAILPPAVLDGILSDRAAYNASRIEGQLTIIVTGEQLRVTPAIKSYFVNAPNVNLRNYYGPTETHVMTVLQLPPDPANWPALPSIGRPIRNARVYLLDRFGEPVPDGSVGEIHIGGEGVARGYLNRPELTAERFLNNPFVPNDRIYRTGDLGRYLLNGEIEYLGRNDFQVKIRGFRIELGEVEAQLASHPAIRENVVVAREDTPGVKRLVAYYTVSDVDPTAQELREYLRRRLPDYMLPVALMRLPSLPLSHNGKLDRMALPPPEGEAFATWAYEPPEGPVETAIANIWSELLGLDQVGRNDSFFDLGGHSLLAVRMLSRLRRNGLVADVSTLFSYPSLRHFAAHTSGIASSDPRWLMRFRAPTSLDRRQTLVLFAPTVLGSGLHFRALANLLAPNLHVATWQLPGLENGEVALNRIEDMATEAAQQLETLLHYEEIVLVGWSFGGLVAFELAQRLTKTPKALVLIDAVVSNSVATETAEDKLAARFDSHLAEFEDGVLGSADKAALYRMFKTHLIAMMAYRPSPSIAPVIEVRAAYTMAGAANGSSTGGRVEAARRTIITLPKNHYSLLDEESLPQLAKIIDAAAASSPRTKVGLVREDQA